MIGIRSLLSDIGGAAIGGFFGVLIINGSQNLLGHLLPDLETAVSPVVTFDPVGPKSLYRDAKTACFTLGITKRHAAIPIAYSFAAEARLILRNENRQVSAPLPVAAYLADKNRRETNEDLVTHAVGDHWLRHYCFEIPATITDKQGFRVTGFALHRRHPLYDTPTPIPPFIVAPLKKMSDPDAP